MSEPSLRDTAIEKAWRELDSAGRVVGPAEAAALGVDAALSVIHDTFVARGADWWVYDGNWCFWCDALCTELTDESPTIRRLDATDVKHEADCPVPELLGARDV